MLFCFFANFDKERKGLYLAISIIAVFLFFAFRIGFTPDYDAYENWFDVIHNTFGIVDSDARIEQGFQYLLLLAPTIDL